MGYGAWYGSCCRRSTADDRFLSRYVTIGDEGVHYLRIVHYNALLKVFDYRTLRLLWDPQSLILISGPLQSASEDKGF